jgi:hypothetical protein
MEAIIASTAWGGEIMGHPEELGKVQPGYYADCILVDTTDLLSDLTILQDISKLHGIFINGKAYKLINNNTNSTSGPVLEGIPRTAEEIVPSAKIAAEVSVYG